MILFEIIYFFKIFNLFLRILDLLAQNDPKARKTGDLLLIEEKLR